MYVYVCMCNCLELFDGQCVDVNRGLKSISDYVYKACVQLLLNVALCMTAKGYHSHDLWRIHRVYIVRTTISCLVMQYLVNHLASYRQLD